MKKLCLILSALYCGMLFFEKAIGATSVLSVKLEDYQLGFLKEPDISAEVEKFFQNVTSKLQFNPEINENKIKEWWNDPQHKTTPTNTLRNKIRTIFCKNEGNNKNYQWLMDEANEIIRNMTEPIIHSIPYDDIQKAYKAEMFQKIKAKNFKKNQIFSEIDVVLGMPVEILQHFHPPLIIENKTQHIPFEKENYIYPEPLVMVASQFNALESVSTEVLPLWTWIFDNTQGPGACMQAFAASALRCAAQKQDKLPDALLPLLEGCEIDGKGILKIYPNLYLNGYFQLSEIKNLNHLQSLSNYIRNNIGKLRIQMQWVRCEESGQLQLQVFCAAPSFQGFGIDWNKNDQWISIYKKICIQLLVAQYRAMAIIGKLSGRPIHFSRIGMGAFNNPPEAFNQGIRFASMIFSRTPGMLAYLHGFSKGDVDGWDAALQKSGFQQVDFEKLKSLPIYKLQKNSNETETQPIERKEEETKRDQPAEEKGEETDAKQNKKNSTEQLIELLKKDTKNFEKMREMIEAGADVNARGNNNWTALHHAIKNGDLGMVEFLVEREADVNARTRERGRTGDAPLHLAASGEHLEIAEYLLSHGAKVNPRHEWSGYRPLHWAVDKKNLAMVKLIFEKKVETEKVDTAAPDYHGWQSLLHHAAKNGSVEIVEYLLQQSADVNIKNHSNKTPLDFAKSEEIKKLLREHGAISGK